MEAKHTEVSEEIACVMHNTGCTEEQARAELEAEEGNINEAVINLRTLMRDGLK